MPNGRVGVAARGMRVYACQYWTQVSTLTLVSSGAIVRPDAGVEIDIGDL